jgi:hypothetical protein
VLQYTRKGGAATIKARQVVPGMHWEVVPSPVVEVSSVKLMVLTGGVGSVRVLTGSCENYPVGEGVLDIVQPSSDTWPLNRGVYTRAPSKVLACCLCGRRGIGGGGSKEGRAALSLADATTSGRGEQRARTALPAALL